ncbi:MAG: TraB/GumN family protein [Mariniblastus sp.]|nr:TraB/GumN family protein [Mariniblastus sp.]
MKTPPLQKLLWLTAFSLYSTPGLLGQLSLPTSPVEDNQKETAAETKRTEQTATSRFMRLQRDTAGEPTALQTAISRYRAADSDLLVDLIGAVHIGEADYYRQLNRQFSQYDIVLYELVAPPGTRVPSGGHSDSNHPLAWLQGSMKEMLGLESQLQRIDYQAANFRHADLSPKQISERMAARGDTPLTVGLSAMADILRQQNLAQRQAETTEPDAPGPPDVVELIDQLGQPLELKKMLAGQFTQSGDLSRQLGPTLNQLLIVDRNQAAVQVLQKTIKEGHKKIAIFYGAAHLPDFDQRLTGQLNLKKTESTWVTAWDLTTAPRHNHLSNPSSMLFKLMEWIDD